MSTKTDTRPNLNAPRVDRETSPRPSTLERARRGDRKAFSRLMEPYRHELVAFCYRHAGSLVEAEDLAQETLVRAFRAMGSFEGRATARNWLYRIALNLCINHAERKAPPWESLDDPADSTAITIEAPKNPADEREDVRLGFVALMQVLPARQRAVLVLRDVLGWSADETARILNTTVPSVKNALARARQTLARHPRGADPAAVPDMAVADPAARAVIAEWVDAFEKGNTARMVDLLTDDDAKGVMLGAPRRAMTADEGRERGETAAATNEAARVRRRLQQDTPGALPTAAAENRAPANAGTHTQQGARGIRVRLESQ
ncbi:MAG: sigma-70 family RNA polymerase sigma factor [Capsulimonadaceae bacterium]